MCFSDQSFAIAMTHLIAEVHQQVLVRSLAKADVQIDSLRESIAAVAKNRLVARAEVTNRPRQRGSIKPARFSNRIA